MPRKRPNLLRAQQPKPYTAGPVRRIRGVSAQTRAAIRRVESRYLWPNAVANALERFERAFRQPGRYLDLQPMGSPGIELEDARDELELAPRYLPAGARLDLRKRLARIDAEFERRTLPEPNVIGTWAGAQPWWWRRIREW